MLGMNLNVIITWLSMVVSVEPEAYGKPYSSSKHWSLVCS